MRIAFGSDSKTIQKLPGVEAAVLPHEARAATLAPRQIVEALLARAGQAGWLGQTEQTEALIGEAQKAAAQAGIVIKPKVLEEVRERVKKYAIEEPMLKAEFFASSGDVDSVRASVTKAKQAAAAQGKPKAFDEARATAAIEAATDVGFDLNVGKASVAANRGDFKGVESAVAAATSLRPGRVPRDWGESGKGIVRRAKEQFVKIQLSAAASFAAKGDFEGTRKANDETRKMSHVLGEPIAETRFEKMVADAYRNALSSAWVKAEEAADKSGPKATTQALQEVRALAKDAGLHFDEGKAEKIKAQAVRPGTR